MPRVNAEKRAVDRWPASLKRKKEARQLGNGREKRRAERSD